MNFTRTKSCSPASLELGTDDTEYRLLTKEHVRVEKIGDKELLVVDPEALTLLANQAFHDINFFLRPKHLKQVAAILDDPEASENDRMVALTMLKNADVASAGLLPFCQDTGTAIIMGKKGQQVWTGGGDEAALSKGVYLAYTENNLRYSQNAALDMFDEKNTGTNLPAQLDLYATDGDAYKFLFIAKGGGSANKAFLYQETRAVLNPKSIVKFLSEKMVSLGTAACPPYHLTFVIGGTSAESTMKHVKLASTKYLRQPAHHRQRARPRLPRCRTRSADARRSPAPAASARSLAANTSRSMCASSACRVTARPAHRHRRFLLRRPPGQGQDHA
jgi:fumarate hydratase class I